MKRPYATELISKSNIRKIPPGVRAGKCLNIHHECLNNKILNSNSVYLSVCNLCDVICVEQTHVCEQDRAHFGVSKKNWDKSISLLELFFKKKKAHRRVDKPSSLPFLFYPSILYISVHLPPGPLNKIFFFLSRRL